MCVSEEKNSQDEVEGGWLRERTGGWDYSESRQKAGYSLKGVDGNGYRITDDDLGVPVI